MEENADHDTQVNLNDEESCNSICKDKGSKFAGIELEGVQCFCVPQDNRVTCAVAVTSVRKLNSQPDRQSSL